MKKNATALLAMAMLLFLVGGAWAAITKSGEAPDVVRIDNRATFVTLSKPTVAFNHAKHFRDNKVRCDQCHHVYQDKKNTWKEGDAVLRCAECHKSPAQNEEGGMLALMNAYHNKCRGCHKTGKKGPTLCEKCHTEKGAEPIKKLW